MKLKKTGLTILLLLIAALLPAESFFSNYDFTFYKTVMESLNISDGSSIGFDYTGFGFIGSRRTSGLIVRLGVQAPYTTLANIFMPDDDGSGSITPDPETETDNPTVIPSSVSAVVPSQGASEEEAEKNEFRFTAMIGPAARYVITPQLDAYAGIGLKLEEHIITEGRLGGSYRNTSYDTRIAADFDMGFKFNLETHTSVRFGLYGTYDLISYLYTTERDSTAADGLNSSASDLHINLIAYGEFRTPLSATGYISMGKTFSSLIKQKVYRYEISERTVGRGTLIEIEDYTDKEQQNGKYQNTIQI